jgi:hypothetical protein
MTKSLERSCFVKPALPTKRSERITQIRMSALSFSPTLHEMRVTQDRVASPLEETDDSSRRLHESRGLEFKAQGTSH